MIFSSFGNVPKDFSRLAKALDCYAHDTKEQVIVQYGHTNHVFHDAEAKDFMNHEELINHMEKADVVVLQGGWGTISEALLMNLRVVAVPRKCPDEHNHDQGELIRKLESLGCVIGVYDEKELPEKIALARNFNFQKLKRGSAIEIIESKIRDWESGKS